MKILRTVMPQAMYMSSLYRNPEMVCELSMGDVVIVYDCMQVEVVDSQFTAGVLRSWLALFDGKVGWICVFDDENPVGFELISEFVI